MNNRPGTKEQALKLARKMHKRIKQNVTSDSIYYIWTIDIYYHLIQKYSL